MAQDNDYHEKELRELLPGKGDLLFYFGLIIYFFFLFSATASKTMILLTWAGIAVMLYAIKIDWTRTETSAGKAGNIVALILTLLFILITLILTIAVLAM